MSLTDSVRRTIRANAHRFPRLYAARNDSLLVQRMRGGVHDPELRSLELDPASAPLVLDIGANVGQAALSFFTMVPNATVVSFEPYMPSVRRLLELKPRSGRHTVVPVALGAVSGEVRELSVPFLGGLSFTQLATLTQPDPDFVLRFLVAVGFTGATADQVTFRTQPVVTMALDDLGYRPDVMKIDVEGAEVDVLRGADRILSEVRPTLFIETGLSTVATEYLSDFDYVRQPGTRVNSIFRPN